jgi:hypothetical protein
MIQGYICLLAAVVALHNFGIVVKAFLLLRDISAHRLDYRIAMAARQPGLNNETEYSLPYSVKGKNAIITGAGSGIVHLPTPHPSKLTMQQVSTSASHHFSSQKAAPSSLRTCPCARKPSSSSSSMQNKGSHGPSLSKPM